MPKIKNKKEVVLGRAIKILDENNLSSSIFSESFPTNYIDIDISNKSRCKPYVTNVLDNVENKDKVTQGYYTNKRIFITQKDFYLVGIDNN